MRRILQSPATTLAAKRCSKPSRTTISSTAPSSCVLLQPTETTRSFTRISSPPQQLKSFRCFSSITNSPGLFSIEGLLAPSDFARLAKEAMAASDRLRNDISVEISSHAVAVETLYQLDQISQTVCNVIDAAELCRSAHCSEKWRQAADHAFGVLQEYIGALNTDVRLYHSLATILDKHEKGDFTLSPEEERFCVLLKREFELDGIHLPDDQREHVRKLHSQVTTLESLFMQNITHQQSQKLFEVDADLVHQVIPKHVLQAHGAVYNEQDAAKVQLATDTSITHSLQSFAPSGDLRKQVYMECMATIPENIDVLHALRDSRHHLAQSLGFESYAHRFLQDKMAQTPANVTEFLADLHRRIQPFYEKEMQILQRAKQQVEGSSEIEPWDVKFYVKALKAQAGVDPNELAPYLSLSNTLEATQLLVQRLFGIRMQEQEIQPAERWDLDEHDNPQQPGAPKEEQIRKFIFTEEETGRSLGTMYLDLHPRPGKYTHAAHFTVRCGCRTGGPNSEDFQLPIVALVCNMNSGHASFSSHQEVETFLHEFGHAMHSLLSRTNFQHLSGTRAAMDFVETPSHWMEHYAWDEQFLPMLAKNTQGESIPTEMMQALVKSRNAFRFLEMQNQIALASFDQALFGPQLGASNMQDISHLWETIHRQNGVPFASGTHWFTNVGHLVTYGAGYYGYLYSQVFATGIWNQLFLNQSMEREVGQRLWKTLLAHGGARDPNLMLEDLLGQKPTVDNYWNSIV